MLGLLGALNFSGVYPLDLTLALGILLAAFGIYTLTYLATRQSVFTKAARNYYLVWGYLPAALGLALVLTPVMNILFALSLALIGLAMVALLIIRL